MEEWQDYPEEDRHHVEALLNKYSLQTIEHMFLEATKSRRNSVASFSTTSGSSVFTHRLSIGSSLYSSSSSDFNPSLSSSASSRSRTAQRAVHYPLGLDPNRPVPPSARRTPYEFTASVEQAFSENSPLSQVDNDCHEAGQSSIHSNERVLFCTFCAEQNVNKTFGTKSDWKKHETRIHETGQEWPCPTPNCCLVFDRDADFSRHHQRSHPGRPLPPLSDVKVQLLPKGVFGCGFDNCKTLLSSWNDRCDHVAKHMKDGMKRTQWRYTNVIRNLIRQDSIRDDWKFLFVTFREQLKKDGSQLCWHPHNTRILRQKLECSDFRPNRDDFLMTTLKLGLDLPPPSVPGSSEQAVALPDGFVTPSFDSVQNIDTLSPEQFRVILRGGPSNQHSRFRLDIPKSPLEHPPEQLLQSPLPSQGITEGQEPSYDHTIGFNSSQDRISFMDVVDTVPELSLSMESMDRMSSCLDSPIPHDSTYYPAFVDPGRPTNPLIGPFPNYFDSAPTIQDSPFSARPSPGQIIKKSLRRAKSNFTLRRSQQLDPATGTNHPDLPAEYEVPRSTAGPSRSYPHNRQDLIIDPVQQFNYQN
ncbi:uncharacterized protein K441DRAFT_570707 [Cenococcum geophilum 1.58]|uniref:uncharacterized protein n=1 Tax=Cenococcum geophilum 1.58 TaxID=794803 RepID=UPI0035900FF4|nr:hypothetical protein K441DRAFT_570707 [Cenococcum geophilum 1.58]